MTGLLCLIFFLSGVAALLFETLWFRQLGLVLGNSVWSSSLVLAGFMGGLALGNGLAARVGQRVRRPVRLYALLELAIGAGGLALVLLLPHLAPLLAPALRPFLDTPWVLNPVRLSVAFALLLVPSTAMGATLPLLVSALFARDPRFGRVLGRLYGWNTLGAVVGALAGDALLLEWLGVRGSALAAAGANALAAAGAFAIAASAEGARARATARPPLPVFALSPAALGLLAAAFLAGGILLALEVVWFRFLQLFVLGGSLAFAIMLAVVLTGIGAGGLVGSWWLALRPRAHRAASAIALAGGAACIASYTLLEPVARGVADRALHAWPDVLALAAPLMLPTALLSGVLFALLGEALDREAPAEARSAGLLALSNTAGAMLGSLAGGFLLLPALGVERSLQLLAGCYALAAVCTEPGGGRRAWTVAAAAAVLLAAAVIVPSGLMQGRYLRLPLDRFAEAEGAQPVAIREGLTETILLLRTPLYGETLHHRLVTNAHSMSSSALFPRRYMKLFVYWPIAVHPDPRRALLISYGLGLTAKALTDTRSLESIDVVDVSRDILDLDFVVYPDPDGRPLDDPRVRVHVEDGRYFLQTSDRRFDLITGEPPPPKAAGIVNLFTREYFGLVRERLADGGIVTYWLPVHSLFEDEAKAVIRAFCDVFADCSLWSGAELDWMLVGTRGATGPVSVEHFSRQWSDPVTGPELRALGLELPEQLGALYLAGAAELDALTHGIAPLDDDHPKRIGTEPVDAVAVRAVYDRWRRLPDLRQRLARSEIVARLWPEPMRRASAAYLPYQPLIDGYAPPLADAAGRLRRLHRLIEQTPLRALVLWQLGSSADTLRAARRALARGARGPALEIELAAEALSERAWLAAAEHYRNAELRGDGGREIVYRRLYALRQAGWTEEANAVAARTGVSAGRKPGDLAVWRFLGDGP